MGSTAWPVFATLSILTWKWQMFVAFFSVSPCLLCVKQCLICKINKSFRSMAPTPFGCMCLVMQVILLAVLCLDVILYCPLLLCMVEITSNSHTSQANEYNSTKRSCCYAVTMLPFCFLWSLSTRGDNRYVIYDGTWFVCRNKELGNELQAAELNVYLVAKDSFLVAKAFQKLKMCHGLYTRPDGVW